MIKTEDFVPWSNCREEGCVPKRILTYHKAVMPRVQNQGKGISLKFVPRSPFYCVSVYRITAMRGVKTVIERFESFGL